MNQQHPHTANILHTTFSFPATQCDVQWSAQNGVRKFVWSSFVFVLVLGLTLFHVSISAQPRTPSRNLDILDTLTREAAQSFAKQLRTPLFPVRTPIDTLRIRIHTHEAAWLLEQALFSAFPVKKRFRASDTLQAHHCLNVRIADAGVRYFACKHDVELLTREISCVLHAHYETNYGTIQELEGFGRTYRDTVQRRALTSLENRQYAFTQASVPEAEPNFWKQVVEPAVVIAAAGIMVALFFFVRTQ